MLDGWVAVVMNLKVESVTTNEEELSELDEKSFDAQCCTLEDVLVLLC